MKNNLRWVIAGVVYLGMAINYLDRQLLSVLAPELRDAFDLTNSQYAQIVVSFQLSYMLSSGLGGRLVDYWGVRLGYAAMAAFWSAAACLHGLASGFVSLVVYRFLLGLGEGGAFPTGVKAMSEWFPRKERALAVGFINASLSLGGVLAPPLTVWVTLQLGWRAAFVVIGGLGFGWVALWLGLYRNPREHSRLTAEELRWIRSDDASEDQIGAASQSAEEGVAKRLLRFPQIWGLLAARFIADPPWQFYMFWLPEYLRRVRHMSFAEIGSVAWVPFLAGAVGSTLGGWASSALIRRGYSPVKARKITMAFSAALLPCGILAALAPTGGMAVVWIGVAAAGHFSWVSNAQTLAADVLPSTYVGTVVGLSQTSGYVANLVGTLATGYVLDAFSYMPVFVAAGLLHPVATVVLLATFVRTEQIERHFSQGAFAARE